MVKDRKDYRIRITEDELEKKRRKMRKPLRNCFERSLDLTKKCLAYQAKF